MESVGSGGSAKFGFVGFLLGIASLLVVLIQTAAFFEPQEQSTASVIGEIAAEIKQSAARALSGEPAPEPIPAPRDYGQFITVAGLCISALAIALGAVGLYRNEPHRLSYLAMSAGFSAFIAVYLFWLAILICGVVLLVSIIGNLDSILE